MLLGGRVRNGLPWYFFRRGLGQGEFFICYCSFIINGWDYLTWSYYEDASNCVVWTTDQQLNKSTREGGEEEDAGECNCSCRCTYYHEVNNAHVNTEELLPHQHQHHSVAHSGNMFISWSTQWMIIWRGWAPLHLHWIKQWGIMSCIYFFFFWWWWCLEMPLRLLFFYIYFNHWILLLHLLHLISTRWMSFDSPEHNYGTD